MLLKKTIKTAAIFCTLLFPSVMHAAVTTYTLPSIVQSNRYTVTVNGQNAPVLAATLNIHCVNFDFTGSVTVTVTSSDSTYWQDGVEIRPYSKKIYPTINGRTVTFTINKPMQISVERPNITQENMDEVLYVFANAPEVNPPSASDANVIYRAAGLYNENIDLTSGQTLYLHGGAVVMGSVDIWTSSNVAIKGRGYIIHNGTQSTTEDQDYWKNHDWHPITTYNCSDITIQGITTVARSRTWSIQLNGTARSTIDNIKVIAAHETNQNGDGIDWYGGHTATVTNSFFRCADDCIAMYSWGGSTNGTANIDNVTYRGCTFWPASACVFRLGYGSMTVSAANFVMEDCDIIRMQDKIGWKAPWSLISAMADAERTNQSSTLTNWRFENLRFDNCNALFGMSYKIARMKNIVLRNIMLMYTPRMESTFDVTSCDSLVFEKMRVNGNTIVTNLQGTGITMPLGNITNTRVLTSTSDGAPTAIIGTPTIGANRTVSFSATASTGTITSYEWDFGDGTTGTGPTVTHTYPAEKVYRVFLTITGSNGKTDMAYIEAASAYLAASSSPASDFVNGLTRKKYSGSWTSIPNFSNLIPSSRDTVLNIPTSISDANKSIGYVYDGFVNIPADGIYTFYIMADDGAKVYVDNVLVTGNDHKYYWAETRGAWHIDAKGTKGIALKAGMHPLSVMYYNRDGGAYCEVSYEGPGVSLQQLPQNRLFRLKNATSEQNTNLHRIQPTTLLLKKHGNGIKVSAPLDHSCLLSITNLSGQQLFTKEIKASEQIFIPGSKLAFGMYQVHLKSNQLDASTKLLILGN